MKTMRSGPLTLKGFFTVPTDHAASRWPPLSNLDADGLVEAVSTARYPGNRAATRTEGQSTDVHLELGHVDVALPPHVLEAAALAAMDPGLGYTPTAGSASLREAISHKLLSVNGLAVDPMHEMVVTNGGVAALDAIVATVVPPGDEVMIPDPGWPNYALIADVNHVRSVTYACPSPGGRPDIEQLRRRVTDRTRAIVVNSPNNPTGSVYCDSDIQAIVDIASPRGLWVILDECYDQLQSDRPGPTVTPRGLSYDRIASIFSFSKTFGMATWRLGYGVGPAKLMSACANRLEANSSCASGVSQAAGQAALQGPQGWVLSARTRLACQLEFASQRLKSVERLAYQPNGGIYVMMDIADLNTDSALFAARLYRASGVIVAPGLAFGVASSGCVRVSVGGELSDLERGLDSLTNMVQVYGREDLANFNG